MYWPEYVFFFLLSVFLFSFRIYSTCFNISNIIGKRKRFCRNRVFRFPHDKSGFYYRTYAHPRRSSFTAIAGRPAVPEHSLCTWRFLFTSAIQQRLDIISFLIEKNQTKKKKNQNEPIIIIGRGKRDNFLAYEIFSLRIKKEKKKYRRITCYKYKNKRRCFQGVRRERGQVVSQKDFFFFQ